MKRALISVYDKENIGKFAKSLTDLGWEIVSTGGTLSYLKNAGIEAIDVTDLTNFPEILGGRVKTLSPHIFGGILYRRDKEEDVQTIKDQGLNSIDMVVVSLYPFEDTVADRNSTHEDIIEKIDIGGPSMIRAAAKNYKDVLVVTDKSQYDLVIRELEKNPNTSLDFRQGLALKAFERTGAYDAHIGKYFQEKEALEIPETLNLSYAKVKDLRYGENPHQRAAYYKDASSKKGLNSMDIIQGKDLSYNNILDISAALEFMPFFGEDEPVVIGIKHTNPCGIAAGKDILEAYDKCIEADSESIYGGIVVLNRPISSEIAEKATKFFLEILIAPGVDEGAKDVLKKKENMRVVIVPDLCDKGEDLIYKSVQGGLLVQDRDKELYDDLKIVTDSQPSKAQMEDMIFAYKAVKCTKSNSVIIVKNKQTLGIGLGDVNRFFASTHALDMAGDLAEGAVVASDGFFPFADSIEIFADKGVSAVIQPGGSIRDDETIAYANEKGISMVFTGMRHFRH